MKIMKIIAFTLLIATHIALSQNNKCANVSVRFSDSYFTPYEKASISYSSHSTFMDSGVVMHIRYKMIPVDGRMSQGFSILRIVGSNSFFWLKPVLNQVYKLNDSTCALRIFPSSNSAYRYKYFDMEALNGLKMISGELVTSGELKLIVQQSENSGAKCECTINYDYSQSFKTSEEYYEMAKSILKNSKSAPTSKFKDAALEQEITKMIQNSKPHYKIKRVSAAQADWSIIKNKLGIIQHRGKTIITVYEDTKTGKCFYLNNFVKQNYIGPNKYGASYFDIGWDSYPSEINCNSK